MKQIIRRYLTNDQIHKATIALKELMVTLPSITESEFKERYISWRNFWAYTLNKRSLLKSGKTKYTHKRLRSAMRSIDFFLPYLFTYQKQNCAGMPNTNNKIEDTFTDLKKNLNNHSGLSTKNCKRFICGFFLVLIKALCIKSRIHNDVYPVLCMSLYAIFSSQSCSPAELCCASNCGRKYNAIY